MLTVIEVFINQLLLVVIGNTLAVFKTNHEALFSIEYPGIFSSYPN